MAESLCLGTATGLDLAVPSSLPVLDVSEVGALDTALCSVRSVLDEAGAVLLRGAPTGGPEPLRQAVARLGLRPMEYDERSTRRREVSERVYGTTEHPARSTILPHNENAYASQWPAVLALNCVQPADAGGQTPLHDVRAVLRDLHPDLVEELCRREVLHVRNFGTGLGLSLAEAFGTTERGAIERTLAASGASAEWGSHGSLCVRWRTRPVLTHPRTGDACFFSHVAFFHQSALPEELRDDLLEAYGPLGLPNNTFYGDGGAIPDDVIAAVLAAFRRQELLFDWRAGDLLFVDNMLCAHARRPYVGARQVLVMLCDPVQRHEVHFV